MATFGVIVILVLMAAISVAAALLPLRPVRVRVPFLAAHVMTSVLLVALLDGPTALWVMVFGPGLAIAAVRLVSARSGAEKGG